MKEIIRKEISRMNIDYKLREKVNRLYFDGRDHTEEISVYTYLLFNANYTNSDKVERGQILTSYRSLAKATHYTENELRTIIARLIEIGLITKECKRRYTIYTLLHYDSIGKTKAEKTSSEPQPSEADRLYFEELERKIRREPLTEEEKAFFNSYLGG